MREHGQGSTVHHGSPPPPLTARRPLLHLLVTIITVALLAACGSAGVGNGNGDGDDGNGNGPSTPPELTWSSTDVGPVTTAGTTEVVGAGEEFVVTASGADIWGNEDSFHYAHVRLSGDIDIRARVDAIAMTHEWAKAGVMIRQALEPGSRHALMSLTPTGDGEFIYRQQTGAGSSGVARSSLSFPTWVRLVRKGTTVRGLVSNDGEAWSEVGSIEVAFDGVVYAGIAVTSRNPNESTQAVVRGVSLAAESLPTPAPPSNTPPSNGFQPSPTSGTWVCGTTPLQPAFTPTYYVSTTGSDSNDGRSTGSAFRTLQRAANAVQPGDVVWIRGGVYPSNVEFRRSGTASAPIVVESYPGECAIFDGTGLGRWDRVTLEGVQHMILRNIVVRNSPSEGLLVSQSHNNVISHVRSYGNFTSGILNMNSNNNLFTHVIMHDNFDAPSGDHADGISISSGDGNRIDRCIAFRNSDDGVDTWRSTNTLVERCISFDNGWQGGDGNGFKAGGNGETVNTVVRYSIAFGNRVNGFDNNTGRNVRFDHNTAYGNGGTGFVGSYGTVRNNLSIGNGSAWGGIDSTQVSNSWNLGIGGGVFVNTDPRHVDFVRLATGSSAVAAGTPIGLPYDGAAPDLGAVPYGQTVASWLGAALGSLPGY